MYLKLLHFWSLYFYITVVYCNILNNCSTNCFCSSEVHFCSSNLITSNPNINGKQLNYSEDEISKYQALNLSFCKYFPNFISLNYTLNKISNFQSSNICHVLEIDLSFNKLTSFEPNILVNFPDLKVLQISNNLLSNFPIFLNSNHLHYLYLKFNRITELLSNDLNHLAELQELKLSSNYLTQLTKNNFVPLVSLMKLDLESNKILRLEGLTFLGLSNLLSLNLRRNNVSVLVDATFWGLSNLNYLDLSFNNIVSIDHKWLYGLYHLNTLSLAHNKICNIDEKAWSSTLNLTELNLRWNRLLQINSSNFNLLMNLRILHLQHNYIQFISPTAFSELRLLRILDLSNNRLAWVINIMDHVFDNLSSLLKLNLENNYIQSIPANAFKYVKKLKILNLGNNQILRIEGGAFALLQDITELNITSNNMLCDCHLGHIVQLLKRLNISSIASCSFPVSLRSIRIMHLHNVTSLLCRDDLFSLPQILNQSGSVEIVKGSNVTLMCTTISSINIKLNIQWYKNGQIINIKDEMFKKELNESHVIVYSQLFLHFNDQQNMGSKITTNIHNKNLIPTNLSNNKKTNNHQKKGIEMSINHKDPDMIDKSKMQKISRNLLKSTKNLSNIITLNNININKQENNVKHFRDYNNEKPNINYSNNYKSLGHHIDEVQIENSKMKDYQIYDDQLRADHNINSDLIEINHSKKDDLFVDPASLNPKPSLNVIDDMSGEYNCLAWNALGAVQSNLSYVDINIHASFVNLLTSPVIVGVGSTVQFDCSAIGVPPPVISLQKIDSADFPAAVDRRLHIYPEDDVFFIVNVQLKDAGVYACHAANRAGDIKANITLKVLDNVLHGDKNFKVWKQSDTIVLECLAKTSLNMTITWLFNNQDLPNTPRHIHTTNLLIITDANLSDTGVYTCLYGDVIVETIVVEVGVSIDNVAMEINSGMGGRMIGAIIIAVVSCVVGTSIVWVCVIYKSRRRSQVSLSDKSLKFKKKIQLYTYPVLASESLQPLGENEYKEIGISCMSPLQMSLVHEESNFKSDSGTHSFSSAISIDNLQTSLELSNNIYIPSTNQNSIFNKEHYYQINQNISKVIKNPETANYNMIPQTNFKQIDQQLFSHNSKPNKLNKQNMCLATLNTTYCFNRNTNKNSKCGMYAEQCFDHEYKKYRSCSCHSSLIVQSQKNKFPSNYSDGDHILNLNNQLDNCKLCCNLGEYCYLQDGNCSHNKNYLCINKNMFVNNLIENEKNILTASPWVLQN